MVATRWQPFGNLRFDLNQLQNEMERMFENLVGTNPRSFAPATYPALNLWEDDEKLCVEAELPGFHMDELEIYVSSNNQLTIKGERKPPELNEGHWHRQERGFGNFGRTIELPQNVDADKVSAEFKDGVLKISLPKKEEVKPRRIEVKAS